MGKLEPPKDKSDKGPGESKAAESALSALNQSLSEGSPIMLKMGAISDGLVKIQSAIEKKKIPEIRIPKPAPVEVNIRTIGWSKTERERTPSQR